MSGKKGQQAMEWYAESKGWTKITTIGHPFANGIDGIFWDPAESKYIFLEAKETIGKGNYEKKLSKGASYGDQMSDDWLRHHVDELYKNGLDSQTYRELKDSIDSGTAKKQVVIYRTSGFSGRTITKGFADDLNNIGPLDKSKINDVIIIGSGG